MDRGDIDVAYVLEGIPGVLGVYAVRGLERIRYAVHLDAGGYVIARVHYALLRVFTHEECVAVALYQVELPGMIREKATRLVLSSDARADASARVPLSTPALEQAFAVGKASPTPTWSYRRALIVTDDEDLACAAVSAFGTDARRFVIADPFAALWEAKAQPFDVILCDLDRAFGIRGFVSNLTLDAPELADRVVLLMPTNGDTEPPSPFTDSGRLRKPLTAANLVDVAAGPRSKPDPTGSRPRVLLMDETIRRKSSKNAPFSLTREPVHRQTRQPVFAPYPPERRREFSISSPAIRRPARPKDRVLVIDEHAAALADHRFETTVARDAWTALDLVDRDWALVACSLAMKTVSGARLYSLLWKTNPALKRRFVLLVDEEPADASRILVRPLTIASVTAMLDRIDFLAAPPP